jgi:hypothetical protein
VKQCTNCIASDDVYAQLQKNHAAQLLEMNRQVADRDEKAERMEEALRKANDIIYSLVEGGANPQDIREYLDKQAAMFRKGGGT